MRTLATSKLMEIGKLYKSNAYMDAPIQICIGHDGDCCVVRDKSGDKYSKVDGRVGGFSYQWSEYVEPVVEYLYGHVRTSLDWTVKKYPDDNVKATFVDGKLTEVEMV